MTSQEAVRGWEALFWFTMLSEVLGNKEVETFQKCVGRGGDMIQFWPKVIV